MAAITVAEALARILAGVVPTAPEPVAIAAAHGRTLAAPLAARFTQPPFDASAMDGYAVRGADIAVRPAALTVIGEAAAGHPFAGSLGPREAVRIFTGAPLPHGADAVVIQENTTRAGTALAVGAGECDAEHIRRAGLDFRTGDVRLAGGRRLGPREVTLAAAMGHGQLAVRRRPRVAILATGDELVLPGETPGPGQITASNHLGVAGLVLQSGGDPLFLGIARDSSASLDAHIAASAGADVLVTIGGASVGDHDLVAPALLARGMTLDFWKIAMRPGKPLMFGRLAGQRVLGLPGNPVSALICARLFLVPLLQALLAQDLDTTAALAVPAGIALGANGPRAHYMRATRRRDATGALVVVPAASQDSSLLSALAAADCLLVRPIDAPAVPAGTIVPVLPLDF